MRQHAPAPSQSLLARRPGALALGSLACSLWLAGCASTPLPPWPSSLPPARKVVRIPPPERSAPPSAVPRAGAVAPPAEVRIQAIPAQAAPVATPMDTDLHYPDLGPRYATPGLAAERRSASTPAEVRQWLAPLAEVDQASPTRAALLDLGRSTRGEPLQALLLTRAPHSDPGALESSGRPTVLLLGPTQGKGTAGREALLLIAQDLAQGSLSSVLNQVNVLVYADPDPDRVAQQPGLVPLGTDLSRDHLRLESPEAQGIARLVRDYRPRVVVAAEEFTVQDPSWRQLGGLPLHDLHWQVAATPHYPEFLAKAAREWFVPALQRSLQAEGLRSTAHHQGNSDTRNAVLDLGSLAPDDSPNTLGLQGAISLQIASRGGDLDRQHLQRRVHSQVVALRSVLRTSAERAGALQQIRQFVERDTSAQACRDTVTLTALRETRAHELLLRHPDTGAEQRQQVSAATPERWQALDTRPRPCGYWLDASATPAVERLRLLDLRVLRIAEAGTVLSDSPSPAGERRAARSVLDVPAGSYYLPLNQPGAALAVAALEAGTPYGYLAHGLLTQPGQVARVMAIPELVFEDQEP